MIRSSHDSISTYLCTKLFVSFFPVKETRWILTVAIISIEPDPLLALTDMTCYLEEKKMKCFLIALCCLIVRKLQSSDRGASPLVTAKNTLVVFEPCCAWQCNLDLFSLVWKFQWSLNFISLRVSRNYFKDKFVIYSVYLSDFTVIFFNLMK